MPGQPHNDLSLDQILASREPVVWPVPAALASSPAVEYRNRLAAKLAPLTVNQIVKSYVYHDVGEIEQLVALAELHALSSPLEGVGIELGAGTGLLASVIARQPAVRGVLAVEVCECVTRRLTSKVARGVLGEDAHKVVPVIGSFDDLRLPDASVEFIVEIDSLHHSDHLSKTMAESARVLKPGGTLLCFDRCHADTLSDRNVERMLSRTYSRQFLEANGYPTEVRLTRRENGEHEYRLWEWTQACDRAGLVVERRVEFRRALTARHALRGLLSCGLHRAGRPPKYTPAMVWQYLRERAGASWHPATGPRVVVAPKQTTVFVLRKTPSDIRSDAAA